MSTSEARATAAPVHDRVPRQHPRRGQVAQLMTDFDEGFVSQKDAERLLRDRFSESVFERLIRILRR